MSPLLKSVRWVKRPFIELRRSLQSDEPKTSISIQSHCHSSDSARVGNSRAYLALDLFSSFESRSPTSRERRGARLSRRGLHENLFGHVSEGHRRIAARLPRSPKCLRALPRISSAADDQSLRHDYKRGFSRRPNRTALATAENEFRCVRFRRFNHLWFRRAQP